MKIYIASSWRNEEAALLLAKYLRDFGGHEVDCFCDPSTGRYVFSYREVGNAEELDQFAMNASPQAQRAFAEDWKWLDWCDAMVLLLPCGNSAHLEAGYAKGVGKKLFIFGRFPKGQWDVMYQFATACVRVENMRELLEALAKEA